MSSVVSITPIVYKNNFAKLAEELREDAERAVEKSAAAIEARAKQLAPVDSGNLRSSIQVTDYTIGRDGYAKFVGTHVHYAPYQEYGTSRGVPPHPFMTPAADEERPKFAEALKEIFSK